MERMDIYTKQISKDIPEDLKLEAVSKDIIMKIANNMSGEGGDKVRVSELVKAVVNQTGGDYFDISKQVRKVLDTAGWDKSKMEDLKLE